MTQDILELKKGLSGHELSIFNSEMEKHKKSVGLAYLLWFFLGTLGVHKFYIGKIKFGIIYLILGIGGWSLLFVGFMDVGMFSSKTGSVGEGIFLVCMAILGIFLLLDLFTISRQIRKTYEKNELEVLQKLKLSQSQST
ncbi:hypothetical protein ES705_05280 [subsurface metagenome]|nr:NINE protein [Clostridia bacterium]